MRVFSRVTASGRIPCLRSTRPSQHQQRNADVSSARASSDTDMSDATGLAYQTIQEHSSKTSLTFVSDWGESGADSVVDRAKEEQS